jgi:hypothetical protein
MNALILTADTAEALIATQSGQHRLGPVSLTDGRWFLMEDVLEEPHFAEMLVNMTYDVVPFNEIQPLLPVVESEE